MLNSGRNVGKGALIACSVAQRLRRLCRAGWKRRRLPRAAILAMASIIGAALVSEQIHADCPPRYSVQIMEGPTDCPLGLDSSTWALGLNDSGAVCGFYSHCAL